MKPKCFPCVEAGSNHPFYYNRKTIYQSQAIFFQAVCGTLLEKLVDFFSAVLPPARILRSIRTKMFASWRLVFLETDAGKRHWLLAGRDSYLIFPPRQVFLSLQRFTVTRKFTLSPLNAALAATKRIGNWQLLIIN